METSYIRGAQRSHLGGELAFDGVTVAHGQRRLIVGQLLEAGEAVVPIGRVVGPPCVSPMACGRCIILRLLIRKDAQRHPFLVMGKIRRETAQADVAVGLCNLSLPMMRLC